MNEDRLKRIVGRLAEKKIRQEVIKEKYVAKNKTKKLTTEERLARIEEFLEL